MKIHTVKLQYFGINEGCSSCDASKNLDYPQEPTQNVVLHIFQKRT